VNNRLLVLGAIVAVVLGAVAVWSLGSYLVSHEYQDPVDRIAPGADETPRMKGLTDEHAEAEAEAHTRPYQEQEYRRFPVVGSRVAVWVAAQLHLLFAAFVLAVPLFAFIIELIGYFTGDERYDKLAHEFTKLLSTSFSFTASLGALLVFLLIALYPKLMTYMGHVFTPTFLPYVGLFFLESLFL